MGTTIDHLHHTLVELEQDGTKIVNEEFMMNIFTPLELEPLDEYMAYIFEDKKSSTTSNETSSSKKGVKALGTYIRRELFRPTREENKATTGMLEDIGSEIASCLLAEMRHPDKLTLEHLSSEGGRLSWLNTTTAKHKASKGKEASNDNSESPFGRLTYQLQAFSTVGINHSQALTLACYNKYFYGNEVELSKRRNKKDGNDPPRGANGHFIDLNLPMAQSLLQTTLELSSEVRQSERDAVEKQQEMKRLNSHPANWSVDFRRFCEIAQMGLESHYSGVAATALAQLVHLLVTKNDATGSNPGRSSKRYHIPVS